MEATLRSKERSARFATWSYVDSILRGIGQVMFQENPYSGALFLIGLLYASPLMAAGAIVGTMVGTSTARMLGADSQLVRAGLFGFNGALVGIALLLFLGTGPLVWAALVVAAAVSTILMAGLMTIWARFGGVALTAPFVVSGWMFLLAARQLGGIAPPPSVAAAEPAVEVTLSTLIEGALRGVGQVFLQDELVTAAIFVLALVVASRRAAIAAVCGSLVGVVVAWLLGAQEPELRAGLFGFNAALTAVALGATFFAHDWSSAAFTLLATIASVFVHAALVTALGPLGIGPLTAPFVLVVWAAFLARPIFARLAATPPLEQR